MIVKISDIDGAKSFIDKINIPNPNSHKGQNGRVLIIGGSSLFHAASIWSAEIASFFTDIVHYSSTEENNKIFLNLKTKFVNGIIVSKADLLHYIKEDDCILVGPGMLRGNKSYPSTSSGQASLQILNYKDLLKIQNEVEYTYFLTKYLIENFPDKRFVFDAGALQMMDSNWLTKFSTKPIITPHEKEFEKMFQIKIHDKSTDQKAEIVQKTAKKYKIVVLLKTIVDIISDGEEIIIVEGGNAGLTKGGTGDILAGLTAALYAKNDSITSAVTASFLLKKSAERLFKSNGYWYNINNLIDQIPKYLSEIKLKSI